MSASLSEALNRVMYLCQIQECDREGTRLLLEQLQQSAGIRKPDNLTEYREYYVIALNYWLRPENNLIKGEGAEFDQNREVTRRYLAIQSLIDESLKLEINPAYTCATLSDQINSGGKRYIPSVLSF